MSIAVRDITFIYNEGLPDETVALNNISVDFYDGEIVGIIGHTGCGKSTLLQQLNGLLRPSEGSIIIDGTDITNPATVLRDIRRKVGLVFQYPEYQLFEETVEKDVAFGPKNIGVRASEIEDRVRQSLELVGLDYDEMKDRSPFDLSGGQKRRVAIAGVLAMETDVLVLDEPTAGLDPESHAELVEMIKRIHRERDSIIIFVSHNMADIAELSDRVVVMDRGQIVSADTPLEIFSKRSMLNKIGLDVPPVTNLMYKLKERNVEVNADVLDYDSAVDEILKCLGRMPADSPADIEGVRDSADDAIIQSPANDEPAQASDYDLEDWEVTDDA